MAKRSFLLLVSMVFTATLAVYPQADVTGGGKPDDVRLTWSENPQTTQTIGWRTDSTVTVGSVQYAKPGQPFTSVSAAAPEVISSNIGKIHLFTVTLRNLEAGTRYRYRVGNGSAWSAPYTFKTEDRAGGSFDFLVFGDSHEKKPSYDVWHKTATTSYQDNPHAKFFVSVGDLIYSGKDYTQWQAWFAACKEVVANIPVFPVIGDHEPRGTTSKDSGSVLSTSSNCSKYLRMDRQASRARSILLITAPLTSLF